VSEEAKPAPIHIVFDGPPGPDGPRFIEAEDSEGRSITVGQWREYGTSGHWALTIPAPPPSDALHRIADLLWQFGDTQQVLDVVGELRAIADRA
jgi:hypothetical protein